MYAVYITPAAHRILKKLPAPMQKALIEAAHQLKEKPLAGEPLSGR